MMNYVKIGGRVVPTGGASCEPPPAKACAFGALSFLSEIAIQISDMATPPAGLKSVILDRTGRGLPGTVWTLSDFLDLAGRDSIDKTLHRLAKSGDLRRIDRSLYDRPQFNSLTRQDSAPDPRAVIDAVARRDQIRVLVDGMTAANDPGITNAVRAKILVRGDTMHASQAPHFDAPGPSWFQIRARGSLPLLADSLQPEAAPAYRTHERRPESQASCRRFLPFDTI